MIMRGINNSIYIYVISDVEKNDFHKKISQIKSLFMKMLSNHRVFYIFIIIIYTDLFIDF
jgi:hypothetical protein